MSMADTEVTVWIQVKHLLNRNNTQLKCLFTHLRMWKKILWNHTVIFQRIFCSLNLLIINAKVKHIKTPKNEEESRKTKLASLQNRLIQEAEFYILCFLTRYGCGTSVLKGTYKEDGGFVYTRSHMKKRRGNRYKMHRGRFYLNVRKKFFTMSTIIYWRNLPRDVAESTSLQVFKKRLDRVLGNIIQASFPMRGWIRWSFISSLTCYIIL